eukprot:406015_1
MALILLLLTFPIKYIFSETTPWDYDHMGSWGTDNPFCGGVDESPINIDTTSVITNDKRCTLPFNWNLDFTKTQFKIKNNGHSVSLHAVEEPTPPNTEWTTLSSTTNVIGRFPNYFASKNSLIKQFCLDGIHFHWGIDDSTGSEHTINHKQFPLEAHFVHFACDRLNIHETLSAYPDRVSVATANQQSDAHELAVISIMFDVSENEINPLFDSIFTGDKKTLKFIEYEYELHSDATTPKPGEIVTGNLETLLPIDLYTSGYYSYEGSLTTPPCTNIVRWYVMNATGIIGATQLEKYFRPLKKTNTVNVSFIAPNFRDVQVQNLNPIYGCFPSDKYRFGQGNNGGNYGNNQGVNNDNWNGNNNGANAVGNDEYSDEIIFDQHVSSHRRSFVMIGVLVIIGVTLIIIGFCIRSKRFKLKKHSTKKHVAVNYKDDSDDENDKELEKYEYEYDGRTNNTGIMEVNNEIIDIDIVTEQ